MLFITWLRHAGPANSGVDAAPGGQVLAGPGAEPVRGARRVNGVLAAVRGFVTHAVTTGHAPARLMPLIYELADDRDLPVAAGGEDEGRMVWRMRARHRLHESEPMVDRASDEEIVGLLRACRSARGRLIIVLMARAGLRRGELCGLRRSDVHLLPDSRLLGCEVQRAHLHVVRRANPNGAWASRAGNAGCHWTSLWCKPSTDTSSSGWRVPQAAGSDFRLVNLFREPIGTPMRPDAINELMTACSRRAGLARRVRPHQLRHAFGSNLADAGSGLDEIAELLGHVAIFLAGVHASRPGAAAGRGGSGAHTPWSGRAGPVNGSFNANAAWPACAVIARNLSRAAGVLAGGKLGKARTATIRTKLIDIPARLAFSASSYTLQLPANSRREQRFITMFDAVQAPPKAA